MALSAGDKMEVVFYCRANGQNGLIVRHFSVTNVLGTGANQQQVADRIDAVVGPLLADCISTHASYMGVRVKRITPNPTDDNTAKAEAQVGGLLGDLFSTQSAAVVSIRTGDAGRSKRGRCYVPFPSENANDEAGHPEEDYLALVAAFAGAITQPIVVNPTLGNSLDLLPVIYSRKLNQFYPITEFRLRKEWGTQRRRSQINRGDQEPIL